jgi:hypothetical protein
MTGEVLSKERGRQIAREEGVEGDGPEMTEQDWKEDGRKAVQRHLTPRSNKKGSGRGAIYQRIMELTQPKVNWRQELKRFIGRLASSSSFKLPNRRHISAGEYRYGLEDTDNALDNAVVALDVSGSIANAFPELAAEVVGIVKAKKIKTISILPFANTVVDPFQIRGFKKPTPDDFAKVRTGGGTEAIPDVIDWIDTNLKGKVDFVVIMTDGHLTNALPPAPKNWGKKTLWLVFDNPGFDVPSDTAVTDYLNLGNFPTPGDGLLLAANTNNTTSDAGSGFVMPTTPTAISQVPGVETMLDGDGRTMYLIPGTGGTLPDGTTDLGQTTYNPNLLVGGATTLEDKPGGITEWRRA